MAHLALRHFVSPERLFAAVDALLAAIDSRRGFASLLPMYVGPLRPGASPPAGVFTPDEYIEAMTLLVRTGLVPAASPARMPVANGKFAAARNRPSR